jgi:hypothetical protein
MRMPFANPFSKQALAGSPIMKIFGQQQPPVQPGPGGTLPLAAAQAPVPPPSPVGGLGGLGGLPPQQQQPTMQDRLSAVGKGLMGSPLEVNAPPMQMAPSAPAGAPGGSLGGMEGLFAQHPQIAQLMQMFNMQKARRGY